MNYLGPIDYTTIAVYALLLLGAGIFFQRISARSMENYFLAGKKMPWWMLGVSGMGTFVDMTGTMLITSFLFMLGPRGLFIEFRGGACLVLIFMMLFTGKWHRRSNCMTGAEWQIYRYGPGIGGKFARVLSAISGVVFNVAMMAYLIKGAGLFLSMFLPFSPFACAVVMAGATMVYVLLAGFYGMVFTDLFQGLIVIVTVAIIIVMAVRTIGGYPGDFGELATQVTGSTAWMSSAPHWHTPMPAGYSQYEALTVFALFYLARNILNGLSTGADPRYFGARNERECGMLTFFWTWMMTFRWPMMMAFAVLGIFLVKDLFPQQNVLRQARDAILRDAVATARPGTVLDLAAEPLVEAILPRKDWDRQGTALVASPESDPRRAEALRKALGADWQKEFTRLIDQRKVINEVVPKNRWEDTIAKVAYAPGAYAALTDELKNTLGADKGADWIGKLHMVSYEGTVNAERVLPAVILFKVPMGLRGLFIVSLIAAAITTFAPMINVVSALLTRDIYQAFLRPKAPNRELIAASYVAGLLVTILGFGMAYSTKNINDIWGWIIMSLGSATMTPAIIRMYWWRFNPSGVVACLCIGLPAAILQRYVLPDMDERVQFVVIQTISFAAAIIGTYLGRPPDQKILENFYRTTKPFGLWGPIKRLVSPSERAAMRREHFYDLVSLPFAFFWQVTLFLLPMQALIGNWYAFKVTFVIFAVALIGLYKLWYRNLPPAGEVPKVNIEGLTQT